MIINYSEKKLSCLILFGSHARGDTDKNSDFDLLGVDNSQSHTVRDNGKINFSLYSSGEILTMSENGDLFLLHITKEGKCLFNDDFFEEVKRRFKYKSSYFNEASTAFFLAKKILENNFRIQNWPLANKRISWCVRTILISESAEIRKPVFSKDGLASALSTHKFEKTDAMTLIDAKANKYKNEKIIFLLEEFLNHYKHLISNKKKIEMYSQSIVHSTLDRIINTKSYFPS